MRRTVFWAAIFLGAGACLAGDPAVSNVSAKQRGGGSKLVDIRYDAADSDGDRLTVSVSLTDNGTPVPAASLSGDVGAGVRPGSGKCIVWDAVYAWAVAHGYSFDLAGSGKAANHPVQTVSWYDCVKWCNARSEKEGRTPCYNLSTWACNFAANGYRLPTNTEWEYAARGGLSGRRFPWGDTIDHSRANYYSYTSGYTYDQGYEGYDTRYSTGGYPYTSPAGSFEANGYGLYDMAGNVWEWCNDSSGSDRGIRGGGWGDFAYLARCGFSYWYYPDIAYFIIGFRSVCR